MEPGAARRAVLVALQSIAPYYLARWAPPPLDNDEVGSSSWRDDSPAVSPTAAAAEASSLPPLPHQRLWQQVRAVCFASQSGTWRHHFCGSFIHQDLGGS